ncbi:MAG: serine hydrolase domain-containing protein [Anaeromyxobacter sp.]
MSGPTLPAVLGILEAGRREGIAPALSAVVLRRGQPLHASCHGELTPPPVARPLQRDDLFDVASLTKVLVTTTLSAQLVEEGRLALDAPVAARLPGFEAGGKGAVTARHLLAHASGLPAWRRYFDQVAADPAAALLFAAPLARPPFAALGPAFARGRALVRQAILAEPLEAPPGSRALYCDPGFIALGFLLEALGGAPLPALAQARIFGPLGLGATLFLDGLDAPASAARAAGRTFVPTGRSAARQETLRGTVHDDNCWALGGAAGHAGLFSTAAEVAAVGEAWRVALDGGRSIVPAAAAAAFARRDSATPGSERALGWDTPSPSGSSLGGRLGRGPRGAIGHLGYTGTSLWVDLDAGLVCALLTDHTHPGGVADRPRIRAFRQRFHDAVAADLGIG